MGYWIKFNGRPSGYVEAKTAERAMEIGKEKTGNEAISADCIPYPANPIIHQEPGDPRYGPCPPFCYTPEQCKGKTSCPKNYACSE